MTLRWTAALAVALRAGVTSAAPAEEAGPTVGEAALAALSRRAGELDTDALVVMKDGKLVESKVAGFRGVGRQGQALIVLKEERLVVVRMREPGEGNTPEENKKYGWSELTRMVRALVKAGRARPPR